MNERWVLVTGAARRLGRVIAYEMARGGWDIIIHHNNSIDDAANLAAEIKSLGRKTITIRADFSDGAKCADLIPGLVQKLGPMTALVNNAALFEPDATDPTGQRHEAINLIAPRILSESFYTAIVATQTPSHAVIINILDADPTQPNFNAYNRSKISFEKLSHEHAKNFAPHVRVNGVALGAVLPSPRQSDAHFRHMAESTPLGRVLQPESVAQTVQFLAENRALTSVFVPLDGGRHLTK